MLETLPPRHAPINGPLAIKTAKHRQADALQTHIRNTQASCLIHVTLQVLTCRMHGRLADLGENPVFLTDRPLIAPLLSLMLTGLQRAPSAFKPQSFCSRSFHCAESYFFCSKIPFDSDSLHPRAYAQTPCLTDFSVAQRLVKSSPAIPQVCSALPSTSLAQSGPLKTND